MTTCVCRLGEMRTRMGVGPFGSRSVSHFLHTCRLTVTQSIVMLMRLPICRPVRIRFLDTVGALLERACEPASKCVSRQVASSSLVAFLRIVAFLSKCFLLPMLESLAVSSCKTRKVVTRLKKDGILNTLVWIPNFGLEVDSVQRQNSALH